ncbi:hypothetical protein [Sphingosinicella sp. LY1275]|uniref:hypothetical protein n=1 Tax=Sphingosinicella sp. LY1275 TaxID=3095379 RepID=UPI002ADEF45A|nr:hypothetical protein [Sphingosinicella sp. LY1275]MEA1013700.1 hypothetical protein [Sphingosinicella sp. LY1275]
MREIVLIFASMFLGALIIFKGDKQSIHLLEGRLFKAGRNVAQAAPAYRKQLTRAALLQFVTGSGLAALSIILWVAGEKTASWVSGGFAAVLWTWGIWGRLRSFIAADAHLAK